MKKITLLFLLFNVSIVSNAQTFNFDSASIDEEGKVEGWEGKNGVLSLANGIMTLTPSNHKNPNIQFRGGIDANANGYVHLRIKNHSNVANEIRMVFRNAADDSNTFVNSSMTKGDTDFQVYTLKLSGADGWSGNVDHITIRFTERNTNLNGAADNIDIDSIIFDNNATMSLKSLDKFNFSFYPNPARHEINLGATQAINQVQIYSLLGQEVLNIKFNDQSRPIVNIASLSAGMYNMKVKIGDSEGVVRIIKD